MAKRVDNAEQPKVDVRNLEPNTHAQRGVKAGGIWKTTNFLTTDPTGVQGGAGYNELSMDDTAGREK